MEENKHHNQDDDDDHDQNDDYDQEEERSGVGGSRWNPTKEQIEMLERMYGDEGVRTPSAEQIQQITARLRVYGHIEGKNVFYWFQNHKARQRQKQRLERLSAANASANHNFNHITRFLAHPHHYHPPNCGVTLNNNSNNTAPRPIFPAPSPYHHQHHYLPNTNVICNPYYQLQGFYNPPQQHQNAPPPPNHDRHHHQGMIISNRSSPSSSRPTSMSRAKQQPSDGRRVGVPLGSTLSGYCAAMKKSKPGDHDDDQGMRTLNLFPVHPTGILQHKIGGGSSRNNSAANSCATSSSSDTININDEGDHHHHHHHHHNPHYIDFFSSGHASSESG